MSVTTSIPLINGVEYAWGDIVAAANGVPFVGITAIKYGDSQDVQNNYGATASGVPFERAHHALGVDHPLQERGRGPAAAGAERPPAGHRAFRHHGVVSARERHHLDGQIRNCQFTENKVDWKEGDLNLQIELTLIPSHIEWGQPKA